MNVMPNGVRELYEAHCVSTANAIRQCGHDERVGRMTVTIHPDDVPAGTTARTLMERGEDGVLQLLDGIRAFIIDGHLRHAAIGELRKDPDHALDWTRQPLGVFLTLRRNGTVLNLLVMTLNSTLLNIASSTVLSCSCILAVLRSVISCARSIEQTFNVSFMNARIFDIRRLMQSENYIPHHSTSTYDLYIHVARLCLSADGNLLEGITELNNR